MAWAGRWILAPPLQLWCLYSRKTILRLRRLRMIGLGVIWSWLIPPCLAFSMLLHYLAKLEAQICCKLRNTTRKAYHMTEMFYHASQNTNRPISLSLVHFFIAFHFLSCIVLFCCTVHCCLFSLLFFSFLATSSINWIWIWMDIDVEAFNLSLMISDIHSLLVTHIRFSCLHCLRYRKMFERVSLILLLLDSQWNYLQQQILSEDCFSTSCCPVKCLK